jgi:hypothetical protein
MPFELDNELLDMIDNANSNAEKIAMETAEKYDVLSEDIDRVVKKAKKALQTDTGVEVEEDVEISVVFVSKESLTHLKYVQSLRSYLKREAQKMVKEVLRKREAEIKEARKGKKRARYQ